MKRIILLLLMCCGMSLFATAQQIPVNPKFGAVSDAEVDLQTYPADTSAAILLLYGKQDITIELDNQGGFVKTIRTHHRWKVLKESGKDELDYEIFRSTRSGENELVGDIRVVTYNREDDKIVQHKMSKKFVFDEKYTDNVNRVTFAPENIKVGSVVEVSFLFRTPSIQIGRIYFQEDYPVNRTDVEVAYAEYFNYTMLQLGDCHVDYDRDNSVQTINFGRGDVMSYNLWVQKFTAVDLPALKEEPFSYCPEHFRSSVNFELHSFFVPGVVQKNYNSSWPEVDHLIAESNLLHYCTTRMKDIEPIRNAMEGKESETEKIAAVRNYLVEKGKWDKNVRLIPKSGKSLLKDGKGDTADLNALVASALNTLGYKAEPVLVKFRTHGPLVQYQISTDQFDAFILKITCPNGEEHLLDAARSDAYIDILDPKYQVSEARLIHHDGTGEWLDLPARLPKNAVTESVQFQFREDGTLGGSVRVRAEGNDAYQIRRNYHSFDTPEAWIEDTEQDEKITISEMILEDPDGYHPDAVIRYDFETDQHLGDDYLYINVFLSKFHSETAFQREERFLPVDFPYKNKISYRVSFLIPDGYEIESLPQSEQVVCGALDGKSFYATLQSMSRGNQFTMIYQVVRNATLVPKEEYAAMREYWEYLARIEKSNLILKKKQ